METKQNKTLQLATDHRSRCSPTQPRFNIMQPVLTAKSTQVQI